MDVKKDIAYVVPHTHWDREWRYPIWKNRMLLIEFMDQIIKTLDSNADYKQFVMDGQSVIIEDYLEVKPQNREKVSQYITEGRIAIGPWYTLPDLYPLDGECLVRNLLKGIRVSKSFGGYLNIGYTSFGWGQTAQFPQIYKGFGINFIVTAKYISTERAPQSEFMWEAPDGTRVLTTRLGKGARHNFFMQTCIPYKYNVDYMGDYRFDWKNSNAVYHKANIEDCGDDYYKIDEHTTCFPETVEKTMLKSWEATDETTVKSVRLFLAGCDFTGSIPELDEIIRIANKKIEDKEFSYGTIQQYVEKVKNLIKENELKVIKGELRDGPSNHCTGNALATRIAIKQLNKKAQNVLIYKAEPLLSLLSMMGGEYYEDFVKKAWIYLLKSHSHDSINGVTQDKTAEDNMFRLNQALEIANVLYEKGISELIKKIDLSRYSVEDVLMVAVNPLPFQATEISKVAVDLPREFNAWDFKVYDCDGNEVEVQFVSRQEIRIPVHDLHSRPWPFYADRHVFYLDTGEIPPCGYKVFKITPWKRFDREILFGPTPMRMSVGQEISQKHNTLENEFVKVEVYANGTFKLTDKITGKIHDNLHYFEDTGDVGDYWTYYPPYCNKTYTSYGCNAKIWKEDNGQLSSTIGIQIGMEVPAYAIRPNNGIDTESRRSDETTVMTITSCLTLKKGSKRLEIKVNVDNTVKDHRVRAMYNTGIKTDTACAAGHFYVDKRPVLPKEGENTQYYPEMQTLPMQSFVDISDGKYGIAFINNSLTEYEAVHIERQTSVALTLFRSVRNIICTEMRVTGNYPEQNGGQNLGVMKYEYAILPHVGDWESVGVYSEARKFNIQPGVYQISAHNMGTYPEKGGLFSIDSEHLVMSGLKKAEDRDSYILRVFNPTEKRIEAKIKIPVAVKEAYYTNLNEERTTDIETKSENEIVISAGANKIVTVEVVV